MFFYECTKKAFGAMILCINGCFYCVVQLCYNGFVIFQEIINHIESIGCVTRLFFERSMGRKFLQGAIWHMSKGANSLSNSVYGYK